MRISDLTKLGITSLAVWINWRVAGDNEELSRYNNPISLELT